MPPLLTAFGVLALVMAVVIFRSSREDAPVPAAVETAPGTGIEAARQADHRRRYFDNRPASS